MICALYEALIDCSADAAKSFETSRLRADISNLESPGVAKVVGDSAREGYTCSRRCIGYQLQTHRFDRLPAEPSGDRAVVDRNATRSTANRPHPPRIYTRHLSLSRCQCLAGVSTSLRRAVDDGQGIPCVAEHGAQPINVCDGWFGEVLKCRRIDIPLLHRLFQFDTVFTSSACCCCVRSSSIILVCWIFTSSSSGLPT